QQPAVTPDEHCYRDLRVLVVDPAAGRTGWTEVAFELAALQTCTTMRAVMDHDPPMGVPAAAAAFGRPIHVTRSWPPPCSCSRLPPSSGWSAASPGAAVP